MQGWCHNAVDDGALAKAEALDEVTTGFGGGVGIKICVLVASRRHLLDDEWNAGRKNAWCIKSPAIDGFGLFKLADEQRRIRIKAVERAISKPAEALLVQHQKTEKAFGFGIT